MFRHNRPLCSYLLQLDFRRDLGWSHATVVASIPTTRSVRLVSIQLVGWARVKSYLDYIPSRSTQGSFILAINMAESRRCPRPLPTSLNRPSGSYLTQGARSYEERLRLHPESVHSG
jgi:hypothetical protein